MPKWLHEDLIRKAKKLKLKGERKDAYIYGTLGKYEKRKKAIRKEMR